MYWPLSFSQSWYLFIWSAMFMGSFAHATMTWHLEFSEAPCLQALPKHWSIWWSVAGCYIINTKHWSQKETPMQSFIVVTITRGSSTPIS